MRDSVVFFCDGVNRCYNKHTAAIEFLGGGVMCGKVVPYSVGVSIVPSPETF